MDKMRTFAEICCLSGIIGVVSEIFGTIQMAYSILLILLVIDTITGIVVAVKNKRFSSRGLSKLVRKVIVYTTSIITVRLLEIVVISLYKTTVLSHTMVAFLAIVEVVSILENLTVLGAPIPSNFIAILTNTIKIPGINTALNAAKNNERDLAEIEEMEKYQIPSIPDQEMQMLLLIKFKAWKSIVNQVHLIREDEEDNNEKLYYKVLSLREFGLNEINLKYKEERLPKNKVMEFNKQHHDKSEQWLAKVKEICFSDQGVAQKKEQVIDSIIILLYKTIIDAQKTSEIVLPKD